LGWFFFFFSPFIRFGLQGNNCGMELFGFVLSDAWTFSLYFYVTFFVVVWGGTLVCLAIDSWNLLPRYRIQASKWPEKQLIVSAFKEQVLEREMILL
jgi:hypothetical protein